MVSLVAGALAVGALASSHAPEESTSQSVTYLRVVHASPDAPMVDVYLDNESVVTNASFGNATGYQTVEPGMHTVTITEAGDREAVVFERNVTLEPRTPTTIAASGEVATDATSTFDARTFTDNAFKPGSNASAVRVVHLAPDAPAVDVTADNGSVVLAENVSFTNASDYVMVPAGDQPVEIRKASEGANGTLIATANLSLTSGEAHTAWVMGYVVPLEDQEGLRVETTQDATVSVSLPTTETPSGMENETATGTATESPTGTANETETETPTGTVTETATPIGTETETPGGNETGTPTETDTP